MPTAHTVTFVAGVLGITWPGRAGIYVEVDGGPGRNLRELRRDSGRFELRLSDAEHRVIVRNALDGKDALPPFSVKPVGPAEGEPIAVPPAPIVVGQTSREVATIGELAKLAAADDVAVRLKPGTHEVGGCVVVGGKRSTFDVTGSTLVQPRDWLGVFRVTGEDNVLVGVRGDVTGNNWLVEVAGARRARIVDASFVDAAPGPKVPGGLIVVRGCDGLTVVRPYAKLLVSYLLFAEHVAQLNRDITITGARLGNSTKESGFRLHNFDGVTIDDADVTIVNKATLRPHNGERLTVKNSHLRGGTTELGGPWRGPDSGDAHGLSVWLLGAKRVWTNVLDPKACPVAGGDRELLDATLLDGKYQLHQLKPDVLRRVLLACREWALANYSSADVAYTTAERARWLGLTTRNVRFEDVHVHAGDLGGNAGLFDFRWTGGSASPRAGRPQFAALVRRAPRSSAWDLPGDRVQTAIEGTIRGVAFAEGTPTAFDGPVPFKLEAA